MLNWLSDLSRNGKIALSLLADLITLPTAMMLAFALRLEQVYVPDPRVTTVILLTTLISAAVFIRLGLYRAVIRYAGLQTFNTIFVGVSISVFLFTVFGFLFQASLPRSVPFIYFGIGLISVSASRLFVRHLLTVDKADTTQNVIIYGAGSAGLQLSNALSQGREYRPVAFIDDDKHKQGSVINGLTVHKPRKIQSIMSTYGVSEVLLAISNVSAVRKGEIVRELGDSHARVKTIPGMLELIDGSSQIEEIRDLNVEDLLGRDQVPPDPGLIEACIKDKAVLVTGAGGSIGSELCRQIAASKPSKLILFELSEFALYSIEQELRGDGVDYELEPILGNVQDQPLLTRIIEAHGVQTIYHAAAYKHVPLVEHNVIAGAKNNILGTNAAARAALNSNVENFILISTDKAVRPTNFMGASKRFAEQILQNLAADKSAKTKFCIVRFGNVLASSGSVVPLFKRQIEQGGPVTVTHPEITRYFMTIPEAVQLVIQAGTLGHGGDVFVLDMGNPVKIFDLAVTMINLMGKSVLTKEKARSEIGIEIKFTGLRPGEKLYEELLIGDNCVGTEHPKITRAMETKLEPKELDQFLMRIVETCSAGENQSLVEILNEAIEEYSPDPRLTASESKLLANSNVLPLH